MTTLTVRLLALGSAGGFLAVALGIRAVTGSVVESEGWLEQYSGTALYGSMVYAGVLVLRPRTVPLAAGVVAVGFCWLIEGFQLSGVPAELSVRSLLARLVLGVQFDLTDLAWYPVGIMPLVAVHWLYHARTEDLQPSD